MTKKTCEKLFKEFKNLKNDKERWAWIIKNQKHGITVCLTSVTTTATFDKYPDDYLLNFYFAVGCGDGVLGLLDGIGVKYSAT
jgi:hypothetical protein